MKITELLAAEPLSADEITQGTAQRYEQVANSLLSLELKGVIRTMPGQRYARNRRMTSGETRRGAVCLVVAISFRK